MRPPHDPADGPPDTSTPDFVPGTDIGWRGGDTQANTVAQQGVPVPIAYGTVKIPVQLIEKRTPISKQPSPLKLADAVDVFLEPANGATAVTFQDPLFVAVLTVALLIPDPATGAYGFGSSYTVRVGGGAPGPGEAVVTGPVGGVYTISVQTAPNTTDYSHNVLSVVYSTSLGSPIYEVAQYVTSSAYVTAGQPNQDAIFICTGRGTPTSVVMSVSPNLIAAGQTGIVNGGTTWTCVSISAAPIYTQGFAGLLCEGAAQGALSVWWDKEHYLAPTLTAAGRKMTLALGPDAGGQVIAGGFDQSGYQHSCVLYGNSVSTGTQKEIPSLAVETQGVMFGSTVNDVNPGDVIFDLFTHARRGCALPSSRVDASVNGTAASSYRVYCDAYGLRLSMLLDTQRTALSIISDILRATNSDAVWSGGVLKIVPLGDTASTAPVYGATNYAPPAVPAFNLGPDDFLDIHRPVQMVRRSDTDCYNSFPLGFVNRHAVGPAQVFGSYAKTTLDDMDMTDVDKRGLRRASTTVLPVIFPDGTAPIMLSRIRAQRSLGVRNTYTFRVDWRYLLLEPTDWGLITEPAIGLINAPVRIINFAEGADHTITLTAEDYPAGASAAASYAPQAGDGYRTSGEVATTAGLSLGISAGGVTSVGLSNPPNDNLWPNGTSENSPPRNVVVKNDGSSPEWDYRVNVGAGAYAGNWIRSSASSWLISLVLQAVPGDIFSISAQARKTGFIPYVSINFLDASYSALPGTVTLSTLSAVWFPISVIATAAPAGTAYVYLSVGNSDIDAIHARRVITPGTGITPGTSGQVLSTSGTTPTWVAPSTLAPAWNAPTLGGGFANLGAGFQPAGYYQDITGRVYGRGIVIQTAGGCAAGTTVYTLPVGYRPVGDEAFAVIYQGGFAKIDVTPSGTVVINTAIGAGQFLALPFNFDTR